MSTSDWKAGEEPAVPFAPRWLMNAGLGACVYSKWLELETFDRLPPSHQLVEQRRWGAENI